MTSCPNGPDSVGGNGGDRHDTVVQPGGHDGAGAAVRAKPRNPLPILLLAAAVIELAVFIPSALLLDFDDYVWAASSGDTPRYVKEAKQLLATGSYPLERIRTPGYPLFLAGAFLLGGDRYGYYVAIVAQLAMNVGFLWLLWRLLELVAPQSRLAVKLVMASAGFIAGLGQAMFLLSDMLAGLCFAFFGYVMLAKRSPWWVLGGGLALATATLTRPTFTWFVVLIPPMAWLLGRFATKVPWSHVAVYVLASLTAVGVNSALERRSRNLVGPDSFFTYHASVILYNIPEPRAREWEEHLRLYHQEISRRAGKPFESLTRAEKDPIAKAILLDTLRSHPLQCARVWAVGFAKYCIIPIESLVNYFCRLATWQEFYYHRSFLRLPMVLLWLPLWMLVYVPPWGNRRRYWPFYAVAAMLFFYIVSLCAPIPATGDRMRIPVLPFMLAWAAVNLEAVLGVMSRGKDAACQAAEATPS